MRRQRLDIYDELPLDMRKYLSHNGWHFNKKSCEYAVKHMRSRDGAKIAYHNKDEMEECMKATGVTLRDNVGYDGVYVFNMAYADFWGSSIQDNKSLCLFVRDMIDDIDQADGYIFNRWLADMTINGIPIEWDELL